MPELHAWLRTSRAQLPAPRDGSLQPRPLAPPLWRRARQQARRDLEPRRQRLVGGPEARRLGWQPGQPRTFLLSDSSPDGKEGKRALTLTLAGTFEPGAVPMERLLVTDIGLAQPLLGKEGRLDRIVFKLRARRKLTPANSPASLCPPSAPLA